MAVEYLKEEGKISLDEKFISMMKPSAEAKQEFNVIGMREEYTYEFKIDVAKSDIVEVTQLCKELLHETKKIILD